MYSKSFADQLHKNYISHHGIKGQKWGVRRFQNVNGTYTAQGRLRRGSKKRGLSDGQQAALALATTVLLPIGITAATSYVTATSEFDHYTDALTSTRTRNAIDNSNDIADAYDTLSDLLNSGAKSLSYRERLELQLSIADNEMNARINKAQAEVAHDYITSPSGKLITKISKKRADKLEQAKKSYDDLVKASDRVITNSGKLQNAIDKDYKEQRAGRRQSQSSSSGSYNYGRRAGSYGSGRSYGRRRTHQDTSKTKSKDRKEAIRNSGEKLDYQKEHARVKELRSRVAKAQRDNTATPEMISELQEAIARAQVAKEQSGIEHALLFNDIYGEYLIHGVDSYLKSVGKSIVDDLYDQYGDIIM